MLDTFCLSCETVSIGRRCGNCGGYNIVIAENYSINGFRECENCGLVYKFPVHTCDCGFTNREEI